MASSRLRWALRSKRRCGGGGANDTFFNADYATALMVLAIAQPADAAGHAESRRLLAAASASLNRSSAEARQLERYRFIARRIAEAQAAR